MGKSDGEPVKKLYDFKERKKASNRIYIFADSLLLVHNKRLIGSYKCLLNLLRRRIVYFPFLFFSPS